MKINDLLNELEIAIKNKNIKKINKIKHSIIHPDDGVYYAIYMKCSSLNTWFRNNKIYDTKQIAEEALREYMYNCLQQQLPYDQFEIRRIVVHETDITNYL